MSEHINPIVSEEDMGADGKLRKWSTGRKAKWIIWIVVIIAVALGFWHQHYMRSDSQIKAVFNELSDHCGVYDRKHFMRKADTTKGQMLH